MASVLAPRASGPAALKRQLATLAEQRGQTDAQASLARQGTGQRGMFIVLEGADGCGKTTQVGRLAHRIAVAGHRVLVTREPGGTTLGSSIRDMVLHGDDLDARTEALLFAADRAEHVEQVVRPALESGAVVVCDRFSLSSVVYQGVIRGLGAATVRDLSRLASGGLEPDVTIVLDVDDATAAQRLGPSRDRMEGDIQQRQVRQAFRDRSLWGPGTHMVDGTGTVEDVSAQAWRIVERNLR